MIPTADTIATPAHEPAPAPHVLACMEVWGGNGPVNAAVSVPGIDAAVTCRPWRAGASGGDIYYLSNCLAGAISRFVLADVAGHGEGSDALARSLRKLMRRHINTPDQSAFARALNEEFARLDTSGRFATALLATYFAPTDHLIICSAGHPHALLYRAAKRRWRLLRPDGDGANLRRSADEAGIPNLPLGVLSPTPYEQFTIRLEPHDAVVLYTDALIEARAADGAQFGENGLLDLAAALGEPTADFGERLTLAAAANAPNAELDDDATVLLLRHNATDPSAPSMRERLEAIGRLIGLVA